MSQLEEQKEAAFEGTVREKMISWIILVVAFVAFWYMLDIVLLTFVITFVFSRLTEMIQKLLKKTLPIPVPNSLILLILYSIFVAALIMGSYAFMPKIVEQMVEIGNIFMRFDVASLKGVINDKIYAAIVDLDFNSYLGQAGQLLVQGITSVSVFGINLFISLILSFLLILEKNKIRRFGHAVAQSRISFIYQYLVFFGKSFVTTFGTVMKVQVMIATINTCISMIVLTILGFPQVLGLGLMIFCLGLIPVAGVIISLIPLSIIAFNLGGFIMVFEVILMILGIHGFEAYILNPKLMSTKTNLPICFVFIILLVAEHYIGVWGLLIGTPIFIFLMTVLEVKYTPAEKHKTLIGRSKDLDEE
ncbi:MAG: AI-2E family transporter [Eubacteriales bacterium]|nr:AI-2E family transporter [Eubacteriales bacterium]